ncbi:MAG: hypothetical protein QOD93_2025 [Acetobacteraceae bacterium]|jgi:hypothetical protein|nr:hypothetical protein [Rhodopila sp.]MEA2732472.1 hypothetical protein [Acetobacteraceae bacterium]MEA2769063.1 hypothetical protein [Acetobacteraceae bacterium]
MYSATVIGPDGHGLPCIKLLAQRPPLGADARDRITAKSQPEPRFICLQVTLQRRLHALAPGLTARTPWRNSPPSR